MESKPIVVFPIVFSGFFSASQALAVDEQSFIKACDAAISEQLRVPEVYQRLSYSFQTVRISLDEIADYLDKIGAKQSFIQERLTAMQSGVWQPTDVRAIITYEATDDAAVIVKKKSVCSTRLQHPQDEFNTEMLKVDGASKIGGKWIRPK